jgi:F0F1-type ATP synthase assembly protein I
MVSMNLSEKELEERLETQDFLDSRIHINERGYIDEDRNSYSMRQTAAGLIIGGVAGEIVGLIASYLTDNIAYAMWTPAVLGTITAFFKTIYAKKSYDSQLEDIV